MIRNLKVRYAPSQNSQQLQKQTSNGSANVEFMKEYEFTHYHLTDWPDHGVPDNVESIINILNLVRQNMVKNNHVANELLNSSSLINKTNKIKAILPLSKDYLAVHCSAGCGRTGTIIAIDQVWTLMNENVIFVFFFFLKTVLNLKIFYLIFRK